ncbi:MAG: hypothetical protein Q8M96_03940, partial [Rubrivivax sp.]|nr:hypothetical protein [Rubrivivax sp.]
QRELWSKNKRDTILMRIAGLIMRGTTAPPWLKAATRKAKQLSTAVKTCCRDWINEAAAAHPKPAKGFAKHCAWWTNERATQQLQTAQAVLRAHQIGALAGEAAMGGPSPSKCCSGPPARF